MYKSREVPFPKISFRSPGTAIPDAVWHRLYRIVFTGIRMEFSGKSNEKPRSRYGWTYSPHISGRLMVIQNLNFRCVLSNYKQQTID